MARLVGAALRVVVHQVAAADHTLQELIPPEAAVPSAVLCPFRVAGALVEPEVPAEPGAPEALAGAAQFLSMAALADPVA